MATLKVFLFKNKALCRARKQLVAGLYFWRMRLVGAGSEEKMLSAVSDEWVIGNGNSASGLALASESALSPSSGSVPESTGTGAVPGEARPALLSGAPGLCPPDANCSVTCPGGERITEPSSCFHAVVSEFLQDWLVCLNSAPDTLQEHPETLLPENEVWN